MEKTAADPMPLRGVYLNINQAFQDERRYGRLLRFAKCLEKQGVENELFTFSPTAITFCRGDLVVTYFLASCRGMPAGT